MTSKPPMTRKHALALLAQFIWKGTFLTMEYYILEQATQRKMLYDALNILTRAIHGYPTMYHYIILCEVCYERYSQHFVQVQNKALDIWCCTPCLNQLQAEQKLIETRETPVMLQTNQMPELL